MPPAAPEILDKIVDIVLAHKPKPKSAASTRTKSKQSLKQPIGKKKNKKKTHSN